MKSIASMLAAALIAVIPAPGQVSDPAGLAGRPADIAASAYRYRADREARQNPPESWIALLRFAGQPLNKPANLQAPAIRAVLNAWLWEEIRPVKKLELIWPAGARRRPSPGDLAVTLLINQGSASSWWNNLSGARQGTMPSLSAEGRTWAYELGADTCGIVLSLTGGKAAADFDVPEARVLTAEKWKTMDVEIEWGFDPATSAKDYSGRIEAYDGVAGEIHTLAGDGRTKAMDARSWTSAGAGPGRRGVRFGLAYMGISKWRRILPFTTQPEDAARTIVTVWTKAGSFSFLAADLENGPILAPEYGFFVRRASAAASPSGPASEAPLALASSAASAAEYKRELKARNLSTIRERLRARPEQTWAGALAALRGGELPAHPAPPAGSEPPMRIEVPEARLTAQWNLGAWHLLRHGQKNPKNGRLWFNDFPYGILAAETYMILRVLDLMGAHQAAEDGFDQWTSLPMDPDSSGHHEWALSDRPNGLFIDGHGCLTHALGPPGIGGHMDGVHAFGPGSIGWALAEHYAMTGDKAWLGANAARIKANAEWMLRQRRWLASLVPAGERLWAKGLQPAMQVTPDSGGLWMNFYECEAYYWAFLSRFAAALREIDPAGGAALAAEAEAYGRDLRAAVERSIALSPVVPVRDGTFRSVIPFACYVRGLATGGWGWRREGSKEHVGPLYWETVQSAAALISPAGLLSPRDVRVQGYLDVLEDRLLLENPYVDGRDWFAAGWQYQAGLERTANMHLAADDIPVFLRSFFNGYAVDVLPQEGYVFNEHAVHGPPDKIFEEAAFLERLRNLLVMEDGDALWLGRGAPRSWLEQGGRISVKDAPTHFGKAGCEIVSDADHGRIGAVVRMPSRRPARTVLLRLRHPRALPLKGVTVDGRPWTDFDASREVVSLTGLSGTVRVEARY